MSERKLGLWGRCKRLFVKGEPSPLAIVERRKHRISRKNISANALKVLYRLNKAEFTACLVGGSVRDLLLNKEPKDFDVATDATPEQIHQLFRNSRIIGRRFRLVHVYYPGEIIEVSTFRANIGEFKSDEEDTPEMLVEDNVFGTIEEDAWRRDFTVNALYYNVSDFSIFDFMQGMADLQKRYIRMIGDPRQRYHEDPVRILRAIRLSAKLDFTIEADTEAPIKELLHLLHHVPPSRLFDEILKLFFEGNAAVTYARLRKFGVIIALFPEFKSGIEDNDPHYQKLVEIALQATDDRFREGKSLNPGFLFSIFLWPAFSKKMSHFIEKKKRFFHAVDLSITETLANQLKTVKIPKRLTAMIRSIWLLQFYLQNRRPNRIFRVFNHRYYRAAYDFLALRVEAGESKLKPIVDWWADFAKVGEKKRQAMIEELGKKK